MSHDADPVLYRSAGIKGGQNRLVVCGCTRNAPIDSLLFASQEIVVIFDPSLFNDPYSITVYACIHYDLYIFAATGCGA